MGKIFSGMPDVSRVRPAGLIVMAAALALSLFSGVLASRTGISKNAIKVISLIICAGGALLAILA